jgi:AcrR family transcriptional regulator
MEPDGRRRTPNRRGEGRRLRADIVEAASEIVDETGGVAAVTLSAVARRIGIATPSIYPHFRNPDAIILALQERDFAALHVDLDAAVEGAGADPVARLQALCRAYLEFARERPQRYQLLFGGIWNSRRALADAEIAMTDLAALGQASLQRLTGLLRDCVEAGSSLSSDPRSDTVALWVGLHGLAHQRIVSIAMDWPVDIEQRLVGELARLRDQG